MPVGKALMSNINTGYFGQPFKPLLEPIKTLFSIPHKVYKLI